MAPLPDRPPRSAPRGITLVEVMVALVLLSVGLLGMAGSSALLLRAAVAQAAERGATRRASLRVAALASAGCAAARDGMATDPAWHLTERWHLSPAANGVVLVDDSLEWVARGRVRGLTIRSAILC